MHRCANGHTDSDYVVYFEHANVVDVGDLFWSKGNVAGGADVEGIVRSLIAVLERTNDNTLILTGHTDISNRRELAQYVQLLKETIALVRQEIAVGKSEKEIADTGLPPIWQPWCAPGPVPPESDFMQQIYSALTHTIELNQ